MTEMVMSGSMSGERKRSDGLLGESDYESRRSHQAPPVLPAAAPLLDSTTEFEPTSRDVNRCAPVCGSLWSLATRIHVKHSRGPRLVEGFHANPIEPTVARIPMNCLRS